MTVKFSSLRADLAKEREGEWKDALDIGHGVAFLVRSTNYPPFQTARDLAMSRLARRYGDEPVPADEHARVIGDLIVEHLLLDWRGLDEPFSEEAARDALTDEAYRRVRGSILLASSRVGQREIEFLRDAEKNSEQPSATT